MTDEFLLSRSLQHRRESRRGPLRFLLILMLLACISIGIVLAIISWNKEQIEAEGLLSLAAETPSSEAYAEASLPTNEVNPDDPAANITDEEPQRTRPTYPAATLAEVPPLLGKTLELVSDPFFAEALFIGDSITTGLDRHAAFDDHLLADIGLTLQQANDRVEDFAALRPKKIYILLGANDLGYRYMDEDLYTEHYTKLLQSLRRLFPDAELFAQSILPVADFYTPREEGQPLTNERIESYNAALETLCEQEHLGYIDVAAAWRLPDGSLHPGVSSGDGLHISFEYYGSWLQILKDQSE